MEHELVQSVFEKIERFVSRAELDAAVERAIHDVKMTTKNKRCAYAWSGGKDSIPLAFVCEAAGVHRCVLGMTHLEYRGFLQWVTDYMPPGLTVKNTGQDLRWLRGHLDMLYPADCRLAGEWFKIVQHRAQAEYFAKERLDMLILGRRKADGNSTGDDRGLSVTNGVARFNPLRDWPHEFVLAFIRYHGITLPPIYSYPRGFRVGTGSWAARQWTKGVADGWRENYQIDPDIVREAAYIIPSAKEYLSCVE